MIEAKPNPPFYIHPTSARFWIGVAAMLDLIEAPADDAAAFVRRLKAEGASYRVDDIEMVDARDAVAILDAADALFPGQTDETMIAALRPVLTNHLNTFDQWRPEHPGLAFIYPTP